MEFSLGIDPGITGAIALLRDRALVELHDLPIMTVGKGEGRVKNQINAAGFSVMLRELLKKHTEDATTQVKVFIEKVSSMPDQGIAGAFSLGDTVGALRGVVSAYGLSIEWITPQSWKKHYRLPKEKDVARSVAINLYPEAPLHLKKHHNRAEAILIGLYGYNMGHAAQAERPF